VNVREAVSNFRGHRTPNVQVIPRRRLWFALSGFFIVLSIVGLAARGLNFSIDFKGGSLLKYPCPNCANGTLTADQVRATLARAGLPDSEVQLVNGDQLSVRTKALTSIGGRPATIVTMPNTAHIATSDVVAVLAEFGHSQASVSATPNRIRVTTQPLTKLRGITVAFPNSKNLTTTQINSTLLGLGYPNAFANIYGSQVVVQFTRLPLHPKPPVASPSPSAAASSGPSAKASPSAAIGSNSSATPSANASASAAPTPTPTPAPSPTPTVQGRDGVLAALAKQEGIPTSKIALHNLSMLKEADVLSALAQRAGVSIGAVQTKEVTGKELQTLLSTLATQAGTTVAQINRQDVGPTWGSQISSKAVKGLIIFLVLVTLYIAFRFEWKMALAAQTALLHDLIITAGIYALVGRTVTPATVIAILTILGYSLYDTVVIFDKVKENTESLAMVTRETYSGVVNISLNQVLMRSVNTSLVVLLPILSLLLFGGSTLKDFAFALFVGVASGTYSSIFVAAPVLALFKEREPKYRNISLRVAQRAGRPQLRTVPTSSASDAGDGERDAGAAATPAGPSRNRPAASPNGPARPKKKRKTTAAQRRRR